MKRTQEHCLQSPLSCVNWGWSPYRPKAGPFVAPRAPKARAANIVFRVGQKHENLMLPVFRKHKQSQQVKDTNIHFADTVQPKPQLWSAEGTSIYCLRYSKNATHSVQLQTWAITEKCQKKTIWWLVYAEDTSTCCLLSVEDMSIDKWPAE